MYIQIMNILMNYLFKLWISSITPTLSHRHSSDSLLVFFLPFHSPFSLWVYFFDRPFVPLLLVSFSPSHSILSLSMCSLYLRGRYFMLPLFEGQNSFVWKCVCSPWFVYYMYIYISKIWDSYLLKFFTLHGSIVDWQCWVSFMCAAEWFSYTCTCIILFQILSPFRLF